MWNTGMDYHQRNHMLVPDTWTTIAKAQAAWRDETEEETNFWGPFWSSYLAFQ